ncbi:MAG: LamG domain-containing protein, partial [Gaiellaceae bacterium]
MEAPATPPDALDSPEAAGAPPDYGLLVLSDSPALYLRFGADEPEFARDETARRDGSYVGAVSLIEDGPAGTDGGAVLLDGENAYVSVADNRFLKLGEAFTLEAWIRPGAIGEEQRLLHKGPGWALLHLTADGVVRFGKSASGTIATSSLAISDTSDWHHLVAIKDGDQAHIFVDGVDVTNFVENHAIENTNADLNVGCTTFGENHFTGAVDEVAI